MSTESPLAEEEQKDSNQFMGDDNTQNKTGNVKGSQRMVSVKNITGKLYPHRGTIRNFVINGTPYMVEPGSAVNVAESYYNKIKNNRDPHGQLIWEKCDPSEVDASSSFRRRAYQTVEDSQKPALDNTFLETFMSLIVEDESRETAINMISVCDSRSTLDHIMKELVGRSGLETKVRNQIVNAIIAQINDIKNRNTKSHTKLD